MAKKKDEQPPNPLDPETKVTKKKAKAPPKKEPKNKAQAAKPKKRTQVRKEEPLQDPPPIPEAPSEGSASDAPPTPQDPNRDNKGRFVKGHEKTGGIKQGQKQKLSLRVQNSVLAMVANEVESTRFTSGLSELRDEDPKGYYQVLAALMKFCAPTLQSQSLEITDKTEQRTIDDRLDELMNKINKK